MSDSLLYVFENSNTIVSILSLNYTFFILINVKKEMKKYKITIDHFTGLREMLSFWMTNHSQKRVASSSSHVTIYVLDNERIIYRSKAKSIGTRLPRILHVKETFHMSNPVKTFTILVTHSPKPFSDKRKLLESSEIICKSVIPVDITCLYVKSYRASLVSMGCISDEKIGSVQLTVVRSDYCNQHLEVVDLRGATPSAAEFVGWDAIESSGTKDCVQKSPVAHRFENISTDRDEKEAQSSIFSANTTSNGIADHPKREFENIDSNKCLPPFVKVDEAKYEPGLDYDSIKHGICEGSSSISCLKKREADRTDEAYKDASWNQEGKCNENDIEVDRPNEVYLTSSRQEGKYNEDDTVSITNDCKENYHTRYQPIQRSYSFTSSHQPLLKKGEGKDDDDSVEYLREDPSRVDENISHIQKEKFQDIGKKCSIGEVVEDSGAYSVSALKGSLGTHQKTTREIFSKDMSISTEDSISLPDFNRNMSLNSHQSHGSSSSSSFYSFDELRRTLNISNKRMGSARNLGEILSPSLSSSPSSSASINSYLLHGVRFKDHEDDDSIFSDTS